MAEPTEDATVSSLTLEQEAEMRRLGIRRVPVDTFHVGSYRYSNLADAIAQAERMSDGKD